MTDAALNRINEKWGERSLYMFLMDNLPSYRTVFNVLDIQRIAVELGMTYQGVYRWMKAPRLRPENAEMLLKLCITEADLAGKDPPSITSFERFVYAS